MTVAYSDGLEAARGFVTCAKGRFARRAGSGFLRLCSVDSQETLYVSRLRPDQTAAATQVSVHALSRRHNLLSTFVRPRIVLVKI